MYILATFPQTRTDRQHHVSSDHPPSLSKHSRASPGIITDQLSAGASCGAMRSSRNAQRMHLLTVGQRGDSPPRATFEAPETMSKLTTTTRFAPPPPPPVTMADSRYCFITEVRPCLFVCGRACRAASAGAARLLGLPSKPKQDDLDAAEASSDGPCAGARVLPGCAGAAELERSRSRRTHARVPAGTRARRVPRSMHVHSV